MTRKIRFSTMAAALLLLVACGYRFTSGGQLPGGVSSIAVDMFTNRTVETGIETYFTSDLVYELTRSGRVNVLPANEAEAVLHGVIVTVLEKTISRKDVTVAQSRRVYVTLDLKMMDRSGRIVWARRKLTDNETYQVDNASGLDSASNKREAIRIISRRMAENIYKDMTDEF